MPEVLLPELRIALAMRGGVSLAVWMGGACSELDALRRSVMPVAQGEEPSGAVTELYRELLEAAGYGSVAVDVVAGASAGGLNGALMACSVVHGMPFDSRIRDLWLQLGGLADLARPVKGRVEDSALDGDGAFYEPLADKMLALTDRSAGPPGDSTPRLDLSLTGTLLDARRSRRHQALGPAILESRNRARFRFRHLPMPSRLGIADDVLSDFGAPESRERELRRLAYAARSTSSFPGAFEPASVGYAEDSSVPSERGAIPQTHYGVFSESRPKEGAAADRDYVIDGGVLDNIPVAWAIRAIAAAPANKEVDRWLVYLQPLQFGNPKARQGSDPAPRARETVKQAQALKGATEHLADDIDELERLRSEAVRRGGFAQVVEYALGQVPEEEDEPEFLDKLFERALASAGSYRDRLNAIEKDRVRRLWTDPVPALGLDPLGYSYLGSINSDKQAAADRSELLADLRTTDYAGVLDPLQVELLRQGDDTPGGRRDALRTLGRQLRTPQHLARAVALLLDSARQFGEPCLAVKGSLYELRSRVELLIACHDRYLASEPTVPDSGRDANELVRRSAQRLRRQAQLQAPLPILEPVPSSVTGWPQGAFDDIVHEVVAQARALAAAAPTPQQQPGAIEQVQERALVSCLLLAAKDAANADAATEAVLVAVELLSGPLRPDPLAESGDIRFHMLSAANQSPHEAFRGHGRLSVDDKLAGNQIANFGAFLSAKWRLNDWTWGRLDAAVSLVELVAARAETDAEAAARLRGLVGGEPGDDVETCARKVVARLHDRILREELPLLDVLDVGPPSAETLRRSALQAGGKVDVAPLLEVGAATVTGVIAGNPSLWRIVGRLGVVSGQAWGVDTAKAGWDTATDKAGQAGDWVRTKAKELGKSLKDKLPF